MASRFDDVAATYDAVRPGYPAAVFDDILAIAGSPRGAQVVEVGAGTGQATEPLARRGLAITALEPGPRLAARARERLASFADVRVETTTFEAWPAQREAFDLVVSATAFHWVDAAIGYRKAFECLRPGGSIALFWNRPVWGLASAPFYEAVRAAYERWAPGLTHPIAPTVQEATGEAFIEESALFEPVTIRRYGWQATYDAARYTDLLRTFSDHLGLPTLEREKLLEENGRLIRERFDDSLVLDYATVLYIARRRDADEHPADLDRRGARSVDRQ